ncbi:putative dynein light chain [Schistosoma mansoni]|uniref:Dynein light chain n=1 Tax=Schistosoma mansoni TaxID=6183 RepID=G4V851_SCHMA|nr:putative dynein light chain [Schistosoma mansoni]|eukprot:XP_018648938.1 putative dynein light chain [Schistosoma mansoni]
MIGIKQSDVLIIKCNLQNEMQYYVKTLVHKALKRFEDEREIATYIKLKFDSHYHNYWQCIVGKHFDCSLEFELSRYILLRAMDTFILLFR